VTEARHEDPAAAPEASGDPAPEANSDAAPEASSDWEWRRKIRANPHSHRVYKWWVIAPLGLLIVAGGLALVPLPGPGWLIVIFGIIVWASEFEWAQGLRDWVKDRLAQWNAWIKPKPLWFKGLVGLATAALVGVFFYLLFLVSGVPSFMPDVLETQLLQLPGL
jgi:uncharacterized protein (TIGR02611 family)